MCCSTLYNLADDAARNEIIDSRAFSQFCGVDSSNQVPDGDTIGRFSAYPRTESNEGNPIGIKSTSAHRS